MSANTETQPRRRSVSLQRSNSSDRGTRDRRPSFSTSRSGSSSRSTSFNLPPDDLGRTEFRDGGLGLVRAPGQDDDALDDEEALDEESEFLNNRSGLGKQC